MGNILDRKESIKELEKLAAEILELKQERKLRRPLLIEFCGCPKSGKSTTITSLNQFLKRNGFLTTVLTERASVCPISNKKDPFFNIWTLSSAIAEIIESLDNKKTDIIIADRAVFDALCWFQWLNTNETEQSPYLDNDNFDRLKTFIKMDLIKDQIDIIYVFKADSKISIEREFSNLLTDRRGSIMQENVLNSFSVAIDNVIKEHGADFRKVITIDTGIEENDKNPNYVSYSVTKNILETLKSLLIEKIGFVEKQVFINNGLTSGINNYENIFKNVTINFKDRSLVEKSNSFIQPLPIAVITNKERDKVLVVKKSEKKTSKDSPERNKVLLFVGGHIRQEDKRPTTLNLINRALTREIKEEIGESINFENNHPFLIYTPEFSNKSEKHLAICYVVEMDLSNTTIKIASDEHIMKTGKSISGHIFNISDLISKEFENLESWSIAILKEVFNAKYVEQFKLFENEQKR
jgi:predicted NUDIX family phosphoesterase